MNADFAYNFIELMFLESLFPCSQDSLNLKSQSQSQRLCETFETLCFSLFLTGFFSAF